MSVNYLEQNRYYYMSRIIVTVNSIANVFHKQYGFIAVNLPKDIYNVYGLGEHSILF